MENLSDALDVKDRLKLDNLNHIISDDKNDEQLLLIISCDTSELNLKFEEYLSTCINNLIKIDNIQDGLFKKILANKQNFKNKYILINLFSIDDYKSIRDEFQFKRDYIPQEKLKFIFLLNQEEYVNFKQKAYDFFSFNNFFHHFVDNKFTFVNDIDISELDDMIDEYNKIKDSNISKQSKMKYLYDIGDKSFDFSHYDMSLKYLDKALKLAIKLKDLFIIASISNLKGMIYKNIGELEKALEYQKESLRISKKIKNKSSISSSYGEIGNIYFVLKNYDLSLRNYEDALKIAIKEQNKYIIASALGNIGSVLLSKGEHEKALEYQKKALQINQEIIDKTGISTNLGSIGIIYEQKGELEKALEYQEKSLLTKKEIGNNFGVVNSLINIGTIYQKKKDFDIALKYQKEAMSIAKTLGFNGILTKIEKSIKNIEEKR